MDPRQVSQRLLAEFEQQAALPNFLAEASKDCSCAHAPKIGLRTLNCLDIIMFIKGLHRLSRPERAGEKS